MTNRLAEEESPYLLQHSDNPVDWYPWCEEAFEEARERDVPVFLSVGYSACHWCHVMEDESFEDPETAEQLNEGFVSIKVDREERPDVDRLYQTVCQMTTGQGGWPLSAWLTPEGKPFHVGTYYPDEPKHRRPSFQQVLESIEESWSNERRKIEQQAEELTMKAQQQMDGSRSASAEGRRSVDSLLESASEDAVADADRQQGGWGKGQKFPHPVRLEALQQADSRFDTEDAADVAGETLDAMASGGMYDHLGGGFHRYCVDRGWTVPHFEKMLYDNALLPRIYLQMYRDTDCERYREVAVETLDFLEREMQDASGGFYSAFDAVSLDEDGEDVEGLYYTWTPSEVEKALSEDEARAFQLRYGVSEAGDVESGSVLTVERGAADVAAELDVDLETAENLLESADREALEARGGREPPRLDDKVLSSWNGLAVSAYAEAASTLEDDGYAETAEEALEFIRDRMWDDGVLYRRYRDGDVDVEGYLEDYAYVARGAFHLYEATTDLRHLEFALSLARRIVEEFQADDGGFYFTRGDSLVARPREQTDGSTPSSAGTAARLLAALSAFDQDLGEAAAEAIEASGAADQPLAHASFAVADDRLRNGSTEVAVSDLGRWRGFLADCYLPARLVTEVPDDVEAAAERLDVDDVPGVWKGREDVEGGFLCSGRTCSPPLDSPEEAVDWMRNNL